MCKTLPETPSTRRTVSEMAAERAVTPPEGEQVKLGIVQKVRIAQAAAVARAHPDPPTWDELSETYNVPVRTMKKLVSDFQDDEKHLGDPLAIIRETLAIYQQSMSNLSEKLAGTEGLVSTVAGTRLLLEAARGRIELMVASGLMPRRLSGERDRDDAVTLIRKMADVLERHDLGDEVLAELLEVVDGTAIDMQAKQLAA